MRTYCILLLAVLLGGLAWGDDIDVRRGAREACEQGKYDEYLKHEDGEVRRYALYCKIKKEKDNAVDVIKNALKDDYMPVRRMAVMALAPLSKARKDISDALLELSKTEEDSQVRGMAAKASWPFRRESVLLRNDPTWDHEVTVLTSFEVPMDKCLFGVDAKQEGHLNGYYEKSFRGERKWKPMKTGYWENQGYHGYDGVAWYRIRFTMPAKMDCNAVELHFGAVDESAWVWLNGEYLGEHDLGPNGYADPFALDCRKEILWGQENVLTVRVLDTVQGGGITKPITLEILK